MNDVIFAHNGPYEAYRSRRWQLVTPLRRRAHTVTPLLRRMCCVESWTTAGTSGKGCRPPVGGACNALLPRYGLCFSDRADERDGGGGDSRRREEHHSVVDNTFPACFTYWRTRRHRPTDTPPTAEVQQLWTRRFSRYAIYDSIRYYN